MVRVSAVMLDVLEGRRSLSDAPQEWLSFILYTEAAQVLQGKTREERQARLANVKPAIREAVQEEAVRLWNKRRGK